MFGVYSSSVILMYSSILDEWVVSPDSVHGNWCPIFGNEIVFVAQGCLSFGLLSLLVYWVGVWAINDKPVPYCIALPFFFSLVFCYLSRRLGVLFCVIGRDGSNNCSTGKRILSINMSDRPVMSNQWVLVRVHCEWSGERSRSRPIHQPNRDQIKVARTFTLTCSDYLFIFHSTCVEIKFGRHDVALCVR